MDLRIGRPLDRMEIGNMLAEARSRTLLLVGSVSDEDLRRQHSPLMSPIVWDLGHIAHFEEVWLLERIRDAAAGDEGLRGIYDPFENPRSTRDDLPLPDVDEVRTYLARVRRGALRALDQLDLSTSTPLLDRGFVFRMVLQHEYQHNETILQTLQLKKGEPYRPPRAWTLPEGPDAPDAVRDEMIRVPGGEVPVGTDDRSAAYDNERPRHVRTLDPFRIDATPVTNARYLEFIADGGYRRRELWSDEGWAWRGEEGAKAPLYWRKTGDVWTTRLMDRETPVLPDRPVCHVSFHEAEAYARWAGKRLPTEFEWEAAAGWDPESGRASRFPWGDRPATTRRANLDQLGFGTAPTWAYPENVSPLGCYGMIGDVWEWTSSPFLGYPGFEPFPYEEYSRVFFGDDFRVLRGGSWATRPGAIRNTFRNWDYPIRRQIFSGFRCARDD